MNSMVSPARVAAAVFLLSVLQSFSTVLTFDGENLQLVTALDQRYGDRVNAAKQDGFSYDLTLGATPNVSVDFIGLNPWDLNYGDLTNMVYLSPTTELVLTADPGYEVLLHSFDLGGWPLNDYILNSVTITSGLGALLHTQADVVVRGSNGRHSTLRFATPLQARVIRIRFDGSNTTISNIGMDNIAFSQVKSVSFLELDLYPGVTVHGEVGRNYRIEYAEDVELQTWTTLDTITLATSPQIYFDRTPASRTARYYRAVQLP